MKNILSRQNVAPILLVSALFAFFLAVGVLWFRDYGTHVDEFAQFDIGERTNKFLKTLDPTYLDFRDWEHGAVFEEFTVQTRRFLKAPYEFGALFYLRHLDTFLTFWASVVVFFLLVWNRFKNWKMGWLGSAMLFLSPVMFGNSFYNTKDLPFLSFYIFSLATLTLFLEKPNLFTAALHALMCGLLINVRIPGLIIPALTVGILALELILPGRRKLHPKLAPTLLALAAFLGLLVGFTILFFPAIWPDPLHRLVEAVIAMSKRNWSQCNLFMGACYHADEIPWYYVPVWMGISTPLLYVAAFLLGLPVCLARFFRRAEAGLFEITRAKRSALVYLGALFLPWLVVVVGQSTVYNSYRHLFFIYVPFLLIALEGVWAVYHWLKARLRAVPIAAPLVVGALFALSFGLTGAYMLRNHPYEFIYFNRLAGSDMREISQNYEMDYWYLSNVDGLRYLLATDPSPVIRIQTYQRTINEYIVMLSEADQKRLSISPDDTTATYFLATYYQHPQPYTGQGELIYEIKVEGAPILSIYKRTGK